MSSTLATWQQDLLSALIQRVPRIGGLQALRGVALHRGLEAYQSNLRGLSARALGSVFPRLREHLGEDDFASMAWSYWRSDPPLRGDLTYWGGSLSDFLASRAGEESGLPALARLEWALHQAEHAIDENFDEGSLHRLATGALSELRLQLRAGTTLLELNRAAAALLNEPDACRVLVFRSGWRARWARIEEADAAFVSKLLNQASLQQALDTATLKGATHPPEFDFSVWLQRALRSAWLIGVIRIGKDTKQ